MKIVLVNTFDNYGGAARAAFRLFKGLKATGGGCTMVVGRKVSDDPDVMTLNPLSAAEQAAAAKVRSEIEAQVAPYPMLRSPGFAPFHVERAPFGHALVNRLPTADVINLHWVRELVDYAGFFSSRPPGQPVVWTLHDMHPFTGGCHYVRGCERHADACGRCPLLESDDPEDLSFRILQGKLDSLRSRTGGPLHVVTPSRWLAKEARRSRLFRDLPISVIPYGLDTDLFIPHDRLATRQAFKLPADLKIILFVAHMLDDPRKGLAYLDEALCRLGPRPDVGVLMVGGAEFALRAQVVKMRAGLVDNDALMSRFYAAADLVAVPSLEDNLPNTMLEAMASGTPVVGFDVGGVPDMVIPGETGFLAPLAEVEGLARALGDALGDGARLAAMGRMARARIEREHTLATQAMRYRDLYRSLVED